MRLRHRTRRAGDDHLTDPFALQRFVDAQTSVYPTALAEIRSGRKQSHWMWFIFPQIAGLGNSSMARHYALRSVDEARAYLAHPVLGSRYRECITALQSLPANTAVAVFGPVDAVKLRSSLTLFVAADGGPDLAAAIDRWYDGKPDSATLKLITKSR